MSAERKSEISAQDSSHLQLLQLLGDELNVSENTEISKDVSEQHLLLMQLLEKVFPSMTNIPLSGKKNKYT